MKANTKKIQIWCTLGPSSLNRKVIERLEEVGVSMFRINLSHTNTEDIEKTVLEIMKNTSVPICLDTEGPQVRTGLFENGNVFFKENSVIEITGEKILGNPTCLNLRPKEVLSNIKAGDLIGINFDSTLLKVISVIDKQIKAKVVCDGWAQNNIAVMVDRHIDIPILSEKDYVGLEIIKKHKLKNISLSFVNKKEDICFVRSIIDDDVHIISKIETNSAVLNLDSIINASDAILIDRGDLSREESINKIPLLQKIIIKKATNSKRQVFVATNILESMVKTKKPLRSEVNDIMNTLLDGADGLVLAAETAIGKYPVECANMVKRMIKYYRIAEAGYSLSELLKNDSFLLIEPHGGELIDRYDENPDFQVLNKLPKLIVDNLTIWDTEQIALGTYSPLKGFMTKNELFGVLDNNKLPNGIGWTMPIILQIPEEKYKKLKKKMDVALVSKNDEQIYAVLSIKDTFTVNLAKIAKKWFGTSSKEHPGVERLFRKGDCCIGGEITLVKRRKSEFYEYDFSPRQMRILFEHKEWSKIAAFHTENISHRVNEYLQAVVMEKHNFDGLLLHPLISPRKTKSLDFLPHVIVESYKITLEKILNHKDKHVFAVFSGYSRYSGPREVVFTAVCRKNFGCSHFIAGQNLMGFNDYYKHDETKKLFDCLDVGIKPVFFETVYYCKKCKNYVEMCDHDKENYLQMSHSEVRNIFLNGEQPPDWFLQDKISSMILKKIVKGEDVFAS